MTAIIALIFAFVIIKAILDHYFPHGPSCSIHGTEYMRKKEYDDEDWCKKCWDERQE